MNRLFVGIVVLLVPTPAAAAPPARDELLRVAPPDAAIVVLVQNARHHYRTLAESPFVQWFPTTPIGKLILGSAELKQFRESGAMIFRELETTPQALIDDVVGEAVAFAYSPPAGKVGEERAVILIRPGKPEAFAKLIEKIDQLQTKSGELTAVARKEHAGAAYFERKKQGGATEYYCFRDRLFAFSSSEADVKAVIDRDQAAPGKPPALVARMQKLGVADAAAVLLVNPRALDAEVKAHVAAAKPDDRRFLQRFAEVWTALDSAAVYVALDANLELGLSLQFQDGQLAADAKAWLTGPRRSAAGLIPAGALGGVAGHLRAVELIDLVASLAPVEAGKPGVKEWIAQTLGPVIGRNNLPLVLDALGPNWALWAEPPATNADLPTLVAAVEIGGANPARAKAEKMLADAIGFGFRTARVAYNFSHADQIELVEEKDAATGLVVTSLVNEQGFPPGVRPSFAIVKGYLVVATSPDAIERFQPLPPGTGPPATGDATLATFSGVRTRAYLNAHGPRLAKFMSGLGAGDEKTVRETLDTAAAALELVDSAVVVARGSENGMRLAVKIKPAKPLKK